MEDPIARFRTAHESLEAVLARFSDEDLARPGTQGEWAIQDVMAHIAAWNDWAKEVIDLRTRQDDVPRERTEEAKNPDPFNARASAAWKGYTPREARDAFSQSYSVLMHYLQTAPHEKLYREIPRPNGKTTTPVATLTALAGHTNEHRDNLEALLAKQS